MSVSQYEDYLRKVKSSDQDYKVETLRAQRKFLYSIGSHHQLWATNTDDTQVAAFHVIAANFVHELINQYDQLLERYYLDDTGPDL